MMLDARAVLLAALIVSFAGTQLMAAEAASPWHRFVSSTKALFTPATKKPPKATDARSSRQGATRAKSTASRKSPAARTVSEFMSQERP